MPSIDPCEQWANMTLDERVAHMNARATSGPMYCTPVNEMRSFVTQPRYSLEDLERALLDAAIALSDHSNINASARDKTRLELVCSRGYHTIEQLRKDIAANKGA